MIENPLIKVIDRICQMAQLHGIAFCKITWDADTDTFNFTPIMAEFITVSYEAKEHD